MNQSTPRPQSPGLKRWFEGNPISSLRREMDDLLENFLGQGEALPASLSSVPRLDVSETDDAIEVVTDLPGFKPDDVHLEVGENSLTISGERSEETRTEVKERKYHRIERRTGSFSRSVWLPCAVKEDSIEAELKDGVLTVTLPKADEAKRHKIQVKGG
ncbi:Spore protein SP21 [Maioricimonas rarisocia]|uniref:Spore protein SP21 n=1 Tax=Maioricimonas rarisocia TaxID=2528026 RepID=A0A517ZBX0_9PLAN|nr:Hsp20/alpha crystallin family protein [Maioricimonas rarisocia]QDU39994.1 Spore protein SP21 [Maioricimonas rarisocia]